jgi:hypothetical protein
MKIEFDNELIFQIKDAIMVQLLKDDVDSVKQNLKEAQHPDDIKYDKKLLKAYRTILKYYGEAYD